jgi:hypothetical protein
LAETTARVFSAERTTFLPNRPLFCATRHSSQCGFKMRWCPKELKFIDLSTAKHQPRFCPDCDGPLREYCICAREIMPDHLSRHRRNCAEYQNYLRMDAELQNRTVSTLQRHKAGLDINISHFGLASDPPSPPSCWRWCPRGRKLLAFAAEDTPPPHCSKHAIRLQCVCLCGSTVSYSSFARHRKDCVQWTAYQQADPADKIRIRKQLWSLLKTRESLYGGTPFVLLSD